MSLGIDSSRFQEGLRTRQLGRRLVFLHEVDSTNSFAKQLARHGVAEGTVVLAEVQMAGRGRHDRRWVSPRGGLWFSVILRPHLKAADALMLTFVAGLAVAETLARRYGLHVETKWPNDVLVNGRKICGILTEASTKDAEVSFLVVGIGVNANLDVKKELPEPLWSKATSLKNEIGHKIRLDELFRFLLEDLEAGFDLFTREGSRHVILDWKRFASFLGQRVEVASEDGTLRGLAIDVGDDGALILRLEDGSTKHIIAGDILVC